jgi:hypothetical protein
MEIKMKTGELVQAFEAVQELAKMKLRPRAAFQIALLVSKMMEPVKVFEAQRKTIIETYGVREGDNISIPPAKLPEAQRLLDEVISTEITLSVDPIQVDSLGDIDVTPALMMSLQQFFVV